MKVIILLGAPGSGKGVTGKKVAPDSGYIHISTGDMLREAVESETAVGREVASFMMHGELVPDDIMARIVEDRLDCRDRNDSYMLDGFPRTVAQADLLEEGLVRRHGEILYVFFFDAPREVLIERLSGRRLCRKCGTNYHIVNMLSKREGVCDVCGGELYQRSDDREATIENRLEVYNQQTESLISLYEKQDLLVRIDSSRTVELIAEDILKVLKNG